MPHFQTRHGMAAQTRSSSSVWQRTADDYRTHVGPVRKEWRTLAVSLMFGVMMVGFAVVAV